MHSCAWPCWLPTPLAFELEYGSRGNCSKYWSRQWLSMALSSANTTSMKPTASPSPRMVGYLVSTLESEAPGKSHKLPATYLPVESSVAHTLPEDALPAWQLPQSSLQVLHGWLEIYPGLVLIADLPPAPLDTASRAGIGGGEPRKCQLITTSGRIVCSWISNSSPHSQNIQHVCQPDVASATVLKF